MNQSSFLSQALWEYQGSSEYTDVTLVCWDGSLPAHAPMLAGLFTSFGISFRSREEVPECLFLPDLTTSEVQNALQDLYLQNNLNSFLEAFKKSLTPVKLELGDYVDNIEPKFEVDDHIDDKFNIPEDNDNKDGTPKIKEENVQIGPKRVMECKQCGEECHGKRDFLNHMKEFHKPIPNTKQIVEIESSVAKKQNSLKKKNMTLSDSEAPYFCNICSKEFTTIFGLKSHNSNKHDEACPYCDQSFKVTVKRWKLRSHIFNIHKDKRVFHPEIAADYRCEDCGEEFHLLMDKTMHMRLTHTQNAICSHCKKPFDKVSELENHLRKTHGKQEHICHVCNKPFTGKPNLRIHLMIHEGKAQGTNTIFNCTLCNKGRYQSEEKLQKHMLDNHSGIKYMCAQCPNVFKSHEARHTHEKRHHSEKIIPCDQCDKMLPTQAALRSHISKVHIKKKDRICPHCGEGFYDTYTFQSHVNRHTNNRQFACELCGKAFLTKSHLRTHSKTHTLPYKCDTCQRCFGSLTLLNRHVGKDHVGVHFECRFGCGWQASELSSRTRHETNYCKMNPVPNAPYTVAMGTANKFTLLKYHAKIKEKGETM